MKIFSLGAALFLFSTMAQAQIIYTDVVPDALFNVTGDTCHLDLDNDGTTDFLIRYYKASGNCYASCAAPGNRPSWVKIDPLSNHAVVDTSSLAWKLSLLQAIDSASIWSLSFDQVLKRVLNTYCHPLGGGIVCLTGTQQGQWNYAPGYLGLRFDIAGNTHYGWARVQVMGPSIGFTLYDYAYNSVSDELILAGDTGSVISTGVAELAPALVWISPNPFTSTLSVSIGAWKPGAVVCTVHALTGEVLQTLTIHEKRSAFTLDLASLSPGAYLLEVIIDGARSVHRIVRQ